MMSQGDPEVFEGSDDEHERMMWCVGRTRVRADEVTKAALPSA
jgi:hypothetical protein